MQASQIPLVMWEMFTAESSTPSKPLPTRFVSKDLASTDSALHFTWYGHSSLLVEIDGKRILVDPMFGDAAAPVSFFSPRFALEHPIPLEEIRNIDAVIISHDHYDHLDYGSILAIKDQVGHFFTALGVGEHLKRWGVEAERISTLDWWSQVDFKGLELVCTPARHFSGRSLNDRNQSLWASWVIKGHDQKLFFSGDSGYAEHFLEIGDRHGPFDLAFIECGQYNVRWEPVHMMPEQSVLAAKDLKADYMMPIHWGSFRLSTHTWTDPILRVLQEGAVLDQKILHPYIGERVQLQEIMESNDWWDL
ncbi:UNVERIFIED_CONTAM: hypothetical protein GTU68_065798 [Idotea baltica]|nr:hypothetical protein [Idotea baltica]